MERRPAFLAAAAVIAFGIALLIVAEFRQRADDRRFDEAQLVLRETFGLFADPAAIEPLPRNTVPPRDSATPAAVAMLSIPSLDVDVAAVEYSDYEDLRTAVGYMPNSDLPGEPGITYFVGHRTGYGAPFRRLDELSPGDVISVTTVTGAIVRYNVTFVEVKQPTEPIPELNRLKGVSNLLLVTCHPEYSTEFRLIVGAVATVS
jgi:LPXTG-site transpeptidase (sortase) family protein